MKLFDKIREAKDKVAIAGAVSKIVLGGKGAKVFGKIEKGNEILEKALEIAEIVKAMSKK